ncbi:hypothetical protein [Lysinibacter sp. HNR]|uniref:hypothetical protein n=1 Tax=Lysinibacter sp. HNR TaxID=3031408 RepID=UPI0024352CF5|nr:hypothetical protein [Lysinibacter sp. HNR]WGD37109.1 hypothetical protein FrondiHNR_11815 [Lysinibacter sp. HNR]
MSDTPDPTNILDTLAEEDDETRSEGESASKESKVRSLSGHKLVYVMASVAVVAMVAGIVLSRFIISPAQAAADAKAPDAGLISVPVEERVVSNVISTRGDVRFADAVEVKLQTGEISGGSPIVTGHVPAVGSTFNAGSIALEVAGRPVLVLPGDLPVYRSLKVGLSGPDVQQLKQALTALGIGAGDASSPVYDAATAAGVKTLYERVGYAPPQGGGAEGEGVVEAAQESVNSAKTALTQAQSNLAKAQNGGDQSEKIRADSEVRSAQIALAEAQASGEGVAQAQETLNLNRALRQALDAPKDVAAERQMVESARTSLATAESKLAQARSDALTPLPAGEVLFLSNLPRRVDEVKAERGVLLEGPAMTVSGATLQIAANVSKADSELIAEGMPAEFPAPDGSTVKATITSVGPKQAKQGDGKEDKKSKEGGASGRYEVKMNPAEITEAQLEALKGQNVKVSIPISATDGKVLAVPLAAVQAGAGGESRIEIITDEEKETTELVTVKTGLAADGFVEVSADDSSLLKAKKRVVVGR